MSFSVSSSAQQSDINVTPLIDVLLALLIIFMVIVPVAPRGLESQAPQESSSGPQAAAGPVSLRVLSGADGQRVRFEIDGPDVAASRLEAALLESLQARPQRMVYVSASADVSYGDAASAVAAAKAAGATPVALAPL